MIYALSLFWIKSPRVLQGHVTFVPVQLTIKVAGTSHMYFYSKHASTVQICQHWTVEVNVKSAMAVQIINNILHATSCFQMPAKWSTRRLFWKQLMIWIREVLNVKTTTKKYNTTVALLFQQWNCFLQRSPLQISYAPHKCSKIGFYWAYQWFISSWFASYFFIAWEPCCGNCTPLYPRVMGGAVSQVLW